jgi:hypothetical protein
MSIYVENREPGQASSAGWFADAASLPVPSYTLLEIVPPTSSAFMPRAFETSTVIPTDAPCDCALRCSTFSGEPQ